MTKPMVVDPKCTPGASTPDPSEHLDQADMSLLASGHDEGLNNLIERHSRKLLHYLIRQLQNEADAEEAAQEAFIRVYQHRKNFNSKEKFTTWLYAIATNVVKDRYRWRSRHPSVSLDSQTQESGLPPGEVLPDQHASPSDLSDSREQLEALRRAIAGLPEDLRTPLILFEYENLSHREIASVMGCSAKAVEARICRARRRLKGLFATFAT